MNAEMDAGTGTRGRLLGAAYGVVQTGGVGGLTLEAVAQAAGVSKGGLLYHFGTKEALIRGMLQDILQRFEADVAAALEDEPAGPGRWLRAFVRATFGSPLPEAALTSTLLTAAATSPHLLDPVREAFARWQARAEADGLDPVLATVVRLAADGLWFADLFGAAPPAGPRRAAVEAHLLQLSAPPADAGGAERS